MKVPHLHHIDSASSKLESLNLQYQNIKGALIMLKYTREELPVSELAGLVPLASEAEQAALTSDIRQNGLREPLVIWQGKIVDGRCRQQACLQEQIIMCYKELSDKLTVDEVAIVVKSLNTRRNLTMTQKVMSACKQSLIPGAASLTVIAKSWAIGKRTLENARYIAKTKPTFVQPLFDGKSVQVTNDKGLQIETNKVTTIYNALKAGAHKVVQDSALTIDMLIDTVEGTDWYYLQLAQIESPDRHTKVLLAELANFKFQSNTLEKLTATIPQPEPIGYVNLDPLTVNPSDCTADWDKR